MVEASTLDLARSVVAEAISRAVAEELEAIRDIAVPSRRRKRDEASGCDEDEAAAAAKKKHESGLAVARNTAIAHNSSDICEIKINQSCFCYKLCNSLD